MLAERFSKPVIFCRKIKIIQLWDTVSRTTEHVFISTFKCTYAVILLFVVFLLNLLFKFLFLAGVQNETLWCFHFGLHVTIIHL